MYAETAIDKFFQALSGNTSMNLIDCANQLVQFQPLDITSRNCLTHQAAVQLAGYCSNIGINRLRIAVALSCLDSTTLDPDIRSCIGLPPSPSFKKTDSNATMPKLINPTEDPRKWGWLCSESESLLEKTTKQSDSEKFILSRCLTGKQCGLIAAICHKTTEFQNGSTFIEGIWYFARDNHFVEQYQRLKNKLSAIREGDDEMIEKCTREEKEDNYMGNVAEKRGKIFWENCGGLWQPARAFLSPEILDSRYKRSELNALLQAKVTASQLYSHQPPINFD